MGFRRNSGKILSNFLPEFLRICPEKIPGIPLEVYLQLSTEPFLELLLEFLPGFFLELFPKFHLKLLPGLYPDSNTEFLQGFSWDFNEPFSKESLGIFREIILRISAIPSWIFI